MPGSLSEGRTASLKGNCICSEAPTWLGRVRTLSPPLLRPTPLSPCNMPAQGLPNDGSGASQPREPVSTSGIPRQLLRVWQLPAGQAVKACSGARRVCKLKHSISSQISAIFSWCPESVLLLVFNSQSPYQTDLSSTVCYVEGGFCACGMELPGLSWLFIFWVNL